MIIFGYKIEKASKPKIKLTTPLAVKMSLDAQLDNALKNINGACKLGWFSCRIPKGDLCDTIVVELTVNRMFSVTTTDDGLFYEISW